jgi:hypothetical protein
VILLFNHTLTDAQKHDAKNTLNVKEFINLPKELQHTWSNIPTDVASLLILLAPIKEFISKEARKGDYILIQGDFGATYAMVEFTKSLGLIPIYATTKREVIETNAGNKVIKKSIFKHERFREYEKFDTK